MKPPLDVREDGGFETRSQPPQPGLTKAAGIAGNRANSLTTHGMNRVWDRVKPTGASDMSVPEQVDWGGCSLSLELPVGHIWCNLRRGVWGPRRAGRGLGWREAGRGCKRQQIIDRAASSGKKGLEVGAKERGTSAINSSSYTDMKCPSPVLGSRSPPALGGRKTPPLTTLQTALNPQTQREEQPAVPTVHLSMIWVSLMASV